MALNSDETINSARSAARRTAGVFLLLSAIGTCGIGYFALQQIAGALQKSPEHADAMSAAALSVVHNRALLIVLAIPPSIGGLMMVTRSRAGAFRWLIFAAGMLWVAVTFGTILYAFLMFIAPLYQYQPL